MPGMRRRKGGLVDVFAGFFFKAVAPALLFHILLLMALMAVNALWPQ